MNKREFVTKLREYLSYELPDQMVKSKAKFYSEYIDGEMAKGRSESEVLEELGDPQLIARSIIDAEKSGPDGIPGTDDDRDLRGAVYGNADSRQSSASWDTSAEEGSGRRSSGAYGGSGARGPGNIQFYNVGCFSAILILLVLFFVLSLIGALLGSLSPVLVPICMVCLILWLLGKTGGGGRS